MRSRLSRAALPLALLAPSAAAQGAPAGGTAAADPIGWVAVGVLALLTLTAGALVSRARLSRRPDPETFLDHLGELQFRLRTVIVAFALYNVLFFVTGFTTRAFRGLVVPWPVFSPESSVSAAVFQSLADRFVPAGVTLVTTRPVDAVLAQVQVALLLAFMVALPLLAYEVAAFLAPALNERERHLVMKAVPLVVGLFVAGLLFGYFFMVPLLFRTLFAFAGGLAVTPLLSVSEFMGFTAILLLLFGIAFELPVVMGVLSRLGLVDPRTWVSQWRYAVVGIFVLAAIITPDPSVVNQVIVALPLLGLYFLGVAAARVMTPQTA